MRVGDLYRVSVPPGAHLGWVGEFLTPLLQKHLDDIVDDYQKAEKNNER
jgi:hypothetical protein